MPLDWFGTPMSPLGGGYSGETFLVGEGTDGVVLRIYRRNPDRAAVDASLLRLVRGIIAVPAVLDVRVATDASPGLVATERLPGVALDRLLRDQADNLDWPALASSLAGVLISLSGVPFLRPGFFADPTLSVSGGGMLTDLADWVQELRTTTRLASWPDADWRALRGLVDQAQLLIDGDGPELPPRTVLVHSDFNPKNLLVDPLTSTVTGVVDWEFAHAGSVFTDIGNLTRFERDDRLLAPLLDAFTANAPGRPEQPFVKGRAADLWALVDLAGRPAGHPVGELASTLLLAQARSGDLSAWPWPTRRVDPVGEHEVS